MKLVVNTMTQNLNILALNAKHNGLKISEKYPNTENAIVHEWTLD